MMEDELIRIWQTSPMQEQIKFEKSRLIIDVQSNLDRIHKSIKYRDLGEIIAAIIVIPVFIYYAFSVPFVLSKIASVWIALWAFYVIVRLRRAKKNKPSAFSETFVDYLYQSRDYLSIQKRLLDSVLYWYILPCLSAVVLFLTGTYLGARNNQLTFILILVGAIVLGIVVYWLNKRAVRKEFIPRLNKIDELIEVLNE